MTIVSKPAGAPGDQSTATMGRPRIAPGLAVVPMGNALLIEGGQRRHLLRGGSAPVVGRVLPLLDGQHDPESICTQLSLAPGQLDQVVRLLDTCGLLDPAVATGPAPDPRPHVRAYLGRAAGRQRHASGAKLAGALAAARVVLISAPGPLTEALNADLVEAGVGQVEVVGELDATAAVLVAPATGPNLAVVIDWESPGPSGDELARLAGYCGQAGLPLLRIAVTGAALEVGPVFLPVHTACVACFREGRAAQGELAPAGQGELAPAAGLGRGADAGPASEMLAALAAAEVLALVSQLTAPAPLRQLLRINLPDWTMACYEVLPEPGCDQCGAGTSAAGESQAAEAYEWLEQDRPVDAVPEEVTLTREQLVRFEGLQTERGDMLYAPRAPLPPMGRAAPARPPASDAVVGGILARVAGLRRDATGPALSRWAPSGGNLGSTELYVIARGPLCGLPGSVFRYGDLRHELTAVRAGPVPLVRALDGTGLDAERIEFAIVLVTNTKRLREKYGSFSLRLGHLDAGCACAQLSAVAAAYGLRASFAAAWPTELAATLDLEPGQEIIAAVAGLGLAEKEQAPCR